MFPLSTVSAAVKSSPSALMAADTYKTADSDEVALSSTGITAVPSAAPSLPAAALMPCAEARMEVGNSSLGMTNVVVLGPMLQKKNDRPYSR